MALVEKMLDGQPKNVRRSTVRALGKIGGEKAKALLLKRLRVEKNTNVLSAITEVLTESYADDPQVLKALKDAEAPQ